MQTYKLCRDACLKAVSIPFKVACLRFDLNIRFSLYYGILKDISKDIRDHVTSSSSLAEN